MILVFCIVAVLYEANGQYVNRYAYLQAHNLPEPAPVQNGSKNCICVPYWQCKEDFSGLVEDGVDIIDIRVYKSRIDDPDGPCTGDFDVCCQLECGRLNNGIKANNHNQMGFRILDGSNDAEFAEFPWMLGILQNRVYKCGASLIHPQVAITAAHCVTENAIFKVRAGEWNWSNQDEPLPYQDRYTKKIIIHPGYNPGSLSSDIAILILDSAFQLAENVGIVCLPHHGSQMNQRNCIATGWGKNSYQKGTYQTILKKVELPIVPRSLCLDELRRARLGPYFNLHRSFICAGGKDNKDTCKGDGGSPLICPIVGGSNRYQQAGIVSWGLTCGMRDTPGVYVNVAMFSSWIDQQLAQHNFDTFVYRSF